MHTVQMHIMRRLMDQSPSRYSQLKPKEIEGNVFTYHLRELINDGLVEKRGTAYDLTFAGKRFLDTISTENYQPRIQPKIVTDVACRNERGEWLLFERKKEPFAGMVGFPSGKIHLGETLRIAAGRELYDKTRLIAGELERRGDLYISVYRDGDLENHLLVHTFQASKLKGTLREESELGRAFWQKVENPFAPQYFPGFGYLVELLENNPSQSFFDELVFYY